MRKIFWVLVWHMRLMTLISMYSRYVCTYVLAIFSHGKIVNRSYKLLALNLENLTLTVVIGRLFGSRDPLPSVFIFWTAEIMGDRQSSAPFWGAVSIAYPYLEMRLIISERLFLIKRPFGTLSTYPNMELTLTRNNNECGVVWPHISVRSYPHNGPPCCWSIGFFSVISCVTLTNDRRKRRLCRSFLLG